MFNHGDIVKAKSKPTEEFTLLSKIPDNGYFFAAGKYLCIHFNLWGEKEFFDEEDITLIEEGGLSSIINPIFDPNFLLGDKVEFKEQTITGTIIAINPVVLPHNYIMEYLIMTENTTLVTVSINEAGAVQLIGKSS